MKKLILPLSLALLGFTGLAATTSAQRLEARVDGPSISIHRGRDSRLAYDLERLNRQLRIVRGDLRTYGAGRRIRGEYYQIARETERLNHRFRRGIGKQWEIRRRVDQLSADLVRLRQELRLRRGGSPIWR